MAQKFFYYHSLDLDEDTKLTKENIKDIFEHAEEVKLTWGGQYVVFKSMEGTIFVDRGSNNLLMKGVVMVHDYSPSSFLKLIRDSEATSLTVFHQEYTIPPCFNLLPHFKMLRVTDYSQTITDLNSRGLVNITESINVPVVDERRFCLNSSASSYVDDIQDYVGQMFEVDCLGTTFWKDLTEKTVQLWRLTSHLKVESGEDQDGKVTRVDQTPQ